MHLRSSAISLTVEDVPASSKFLADHFGFTERMAADGFASLSRPDAAFDLFFLRRGLEVLPEGLRTRLADGVIVAFVVDDLEAEQSRLLAEGVALTLPLREEPWGERLLLVTDPNGVVYELVEWTAPQGDG
jgi:catechol 2,3-dioxygenase-like lactoylglutathione lyase family enzyme